MGLPFVAIVLLNYNGRDDTLECLASLQKLTYPSFLAIVVDQASSDGCVAAVRSSFPEVLVVENPENTGFTGGNNLGIRAALERGADAIFLLNNDTLVAPDLLDILVQTDHESTTPQILGPLMLYADPPERIWSSGGKIDPQGRITQCNQEEPPESLSSDGALLPRDYIVGCGFYARRALWEDVGLLDERYFLYFEETDLCARARRAGWHCATVPSARLWHKVSKSTGVDSPLTTYYMRRNQLLYLKNNSTTAGFLAALLDSLRLLGVWTVRNDPRQKALRKALVDFLRGNFGKGW